MHSSISLVHSIKRNNAVVISYPDTTFLQNGYGFAYQHFISYKSGIIDTL